MFLYLLSVGYTVDMRQSTREWLDDIETRFEAGRANDFADYVPLDRLFRDIPAHIRRNGRRHAKAETLGYRVTRHLGPIGVFWCSMLVSNPGNVRSAADLLSFVYLGDFMFHMDTVTEDYYQSWVSKVHFPRWLHYHIGPRRDCTHA